MTARTFYTANISDGPEPAIQERLARMAFDRAEAANGVRLGPMRRDPEEEARLAETHPDQTCVVYAADVLDENAGIPVGTE